METMLGNVLTVQKRCYHVLYSSFVPGKSTETMLRKVLKDLDMVLMYSFCCCRHWQSMESLLKSVPDGRDRVFLCCFSPW